MNAEHDRAEGGAQGTDDAPLRDRTARVDLSRTWEIELFISGATLFALLQAPRAVDRWYTHAQPHLAGTADLAVFFAFYYAKLILYTLIATFVLHLFARAYWVGLVGLHSVYPGGVRWSELKYGPVFKSVFREKLPTLERSIRRVDDISSLLFSGGAVILLMFMASVILVGPLLLLSVLLSYLALDGRYAEGLVIVLVFVAASFPMVTRWLDIRRARKGDGTPPTGGLRRAAVYSYYIGGTPVLGPLAMTLSSNIGHRSAGVASTVVFLLIVGTFVVRDVLLPRGGVRADSHVYLPDATAAHEMDSRHYADEHGDGRVYTTAPWIQSAVITEPYVRLFVPITPERHNALIGERCPHLPEQPSGLRLVTTRATGAEPPDIRPFLDCVSTFQPISLNGAPLDGASWRLATDPRTGVRGLITFISTEGLEAGEHVLRIEGLPRPRDAQRARRERPARPPHIIRFWL